MPNSRDDEVTSNTTSSNEDATSEPDDTTPSDETADEVDASAHGQAGDDEPGPAALGPTVSTPADDLEGARDSAHVDAEPDHEATAVHPGPDEAAAARHLPPSGFFDAFTLHDWQTRVAVLLMAILLLFPFLGSFGLWDPWEVHYGEVGRQFVERGDWISPWWGSHWKPPGKSPEGEFFFSKPILLLWMMGLGLQVFGFSELGIRFGVALVATIGVYAVYRMGASIWTRRVGVLMAVALLTSPFYAMLGRQAQTDMPFVGLMTAAMAFFIMGMFGRDRDRPASRGDWWLYWTAFAALVVPQLHTITVGQLRWRSNLSWIEAFFCYGPTQLAIYVLLFAGLAWTTWRRPAQPLGRLHLYWFYTFVALATMGKGILGFALPGAIILVYLVVTNEWALLRRAEIPRGIAIATVVGFPWYGAMFARHGGIGGAFWDRFIIHDHFKRLASGVHQTDTGSFEHFIRWLGYGLFPWGSFVPAIIARALGGERGNNRTDRDRAALMIFLWFVIAFTLFTASSTKFHHYIFPAVPALALLAALFLDDVLEQRVALAAWWPMYTAAIALFVLVGFDLVAEPQNLKNMFTYMYDRQWDAESWNRGFKIATAVIAAIGAVGMLFLARPDLRRAALAGVVTLGISSYAMAAWALHVYMPGISDTWSQKGMWDTYYAECTPVEGPPGSHPMKRYCLEPAISYKLNWRGETYYTQNEVLPVRDDDEWKYFLQINGDRCFYAIMEKSRINGFRNALPAEQRASVQEAHTDNIKFGFVRANCHKQNRKDAATAEGSGEIRNDAPRD